MGVGKAPLGGGKPPLEGGQLPPVQAQTAPLSYFSKVIEKILSIRLTHFFDKFNLFSASQYGFRRGLSTFHALNELTNRIYDSLDSKKLHLIC